MLTVTLYIREDCSLCEKALEDLADLQQEFPHRLIQIDVEKEGLAEYIEQIPVLETGPFKVKAPFDKKKLRMTLGAAQDRKSQLDKIQSVSEQQDVERDKSFTFVDRIFYWLSRRYMIVFNLFAFIYVGLAFLAPVLLAGGNRGPANIIYEVYGRLCHQLAFRSWFLNGEQAAYPRELADIEGLGTYEDLIGLDPYDVEAAYQFRGNDLIGYKVALCQRDIAIYGSLLVFGLIFSATKRKIPPLPIAAWVVLGILPIGLDGFSQLISQLPWEIIPVRESTPLLRTITGSLFGFSTAWFSYPVVEQAMSETRKVLSIKMKASQSEKGS